MFTSIKSFLGFSNETEETRRKRLFALTMQLEQLTGDKMRLMAGDTIEIAKTIRDMVVSEAMSIHKSDRTRIFKIMNRAKVRALQLGDIKGYKVFRTLDSISGDLVPL